MEKSNQFFETTKPSRLFFTVAVPGTISMLAMSLYFIIEGIFIGHILNEAAFAAVNLAMPFVFINFSLADMIGVGSSVPISIALGRREYKKANEIFSSSLVLIVLTSIFMGALLYFFSPLFIELMGASGEMAILAVKYVRIYALTGPFTTVLFAMDNYLKISGFVKTSMAINLFMSALNVALLYLFLSGFKMNVEGCALATSIAMSVCAVLTFIPFLTGKTVLKFTYPKISGKNLKEIVSCGAPIFLNNVSGRVAAIVMNVALLSIGGAVYGQTAVAAYSVLMYAAEIVQPLFYGMSDSISPAIGYNWGAKRLDRVSAITKWSFSMCFIVSLVGTAFMFFFPELVAKLFVDTTQVALFEMSTHALRLFSFTFVSRWAGFAVQSFYSSIHKPFLASILSVSSAMILPIAFIIILSPLGLDGLWLNMAATSFVVMIMAFIMLFFSQKKMKKDIENPLR